MGRLLIVLLLAVAVLLWWKHRQRGKRSEEAAPHRPRESTGPEAMLRCAECGVHLPSSQVLPGRGGVFCCHEHRERFEARQ